MFVPTNEGFARWLNIFRNTSGVPQTVRMQTSNNLGSDANTRIVTTSDGDALPELSDTWVTTFQNYSGTTSNDPRLGHVLRGLDATVGLNAIQFVNGDDNPLWRYQFVLGPGQTGIIMNYATAQATRAAAATESAALANLSSANALACMTTTERDQVVNFGLSADSITTQASGGGPVGTQVPDTATLSGFSSPTGTITSGCTARTTPRVPARPCSPAPRFRSTATRATTGQLHARHGRTYRWTAAYSGDGINAPASSPCNAPNESVTITSVSATTTLATQASSGGPVGTQVSDTATLSGGNNPTGTIQFQLFGPNDATCAAAPVFTSAPVAVNGNGSYGSGNFTPTAPGTYLWTASYSGDPNNLAATSPCNSANESVTITKASPTISTQASAGAPLGTEVTDTATVAGGFNPTGIVTFRLFSDAVCTNQVFTSTNNLAGGSATSGGFTPTSPGTYRWTAVYNGDANNNTATSGCNAPDESVTSPPWARRSPPRRRRVDRSARR